MLSLAVQTESSCTWSATLTARVPSRVPLPPHPSTLPAAQTAATRPSKPVCKNGSRPPPLPLSPECSPPQPSPPEERAPRGRLQALAPPAAGSDDRFETYGRALSEILWYDVGRENDLEAVASVVLAVDSYSLRDSIATARTPAAGGVLYPQLGGGDARRSVLYRGAKGLLPYRSLLFVFNQLLASILVSSQTKRGGRRSTST